MPHCLCEHAIAQVPGRPIVHDKRCFLVEERIAFNDSIRRFALERHQDESGVSGTGRVAVGVEFSDGQTVLKWLTHVNSLAVYPNVGALVKIHGHDGKTEIKWLD